ncbi:MAG: hypothetical protein HY721_12435 [Planctomycetes bacterium]|nr:hypothetical protein [Planctomycetota bacterium]
MNPLALLAHLPLLAFLPLLALLAFLPHLALLAAPDKPLDCHVVFAPAGSTTEGSGYTAIVAAPDGKVYFGAARYGGYAWLLELDPEKRVVRKVADLGEITGERLSGIRTQAKIHAKMAVSSDGKLYFASKQGHEVFETRPEHEDAAGYPGGHLCAYDTKTAVVRDLGIPLRGEGLIWCLLDEARGRVYLKSEPKNHLLCYDLAAGTPTDLGNLGSSCRYAALDDRGVLYTVGRESTLCRYDPEKDFVEELRVAVEGAGGYAPPYVVAIEPRPKAGAPSRLYGLTGGHPFVMEFDVERAGSEVTVRNAAPAVPEGRKNLDIHAAVFGKDGRLYFPVLTDGDELHVLRFDPGDRDVADLGVARPLDLDDAAHRHLYVRGQSYRLDYIQGAAVGPDGTLFLMDIYPQLNVAMFPRLTAP